MKIRTFAGSSNRHVLAGLALGLGVSLLSTTAGATVMDYTVTLSELNNSGVSGGGTLAFDDVANTLSVDYSVSGLEDGQHAQHIHGLFEGSDPGPGGTPVDSMTPDDSFDSDGDGFVEVLEAAPAYGDILLSLTLESGEFPSATGGILNYNRVFDLDNLGIFTPSPVGDNLTYGPEDLFPLNLREIVVHGMSVADGVGAGTPGEVDGTPGFKGVLPVAAGEIELAAAAVPEPGTLSILGLGLVGLVFSGYRRRARADAISA